MNKDIGSGALLLLVAAGYYWATQQIAVSSLSDEVGAHGMPTVLAAALGVVGALILGRGLLASRRTVPAAVAPASESPASESPPSESPDSESGDADDLYEATLPRALGLLAIGALYIAVGMLVGYIPALAVLIFATAIYEGMPLGWQPAAVALGGAVVFWLLFVKLLGTEQPIGLLTGL